MNILAIDPGSIHSATNQSGEASIAPEVLVINGPSYTGAIA